MFKFKENRNVAQTSFVFPKGKSFLLSSLFFTILLLCGMWAISNFTPELILKQQIDFRDSSIPIIINPTKNFFDTFYDKYLNFNNKDFDIWLFTNGIIFWFCQITFLLMTTFFSWFEIRQFFVYFYYNKWFPYCLEQHAKIINSCKNLKFNNKVALIVAVCDDFSPNTLLQTTNQTYKNIDVWICDDSTKQQSIDNINSFCKIHNFNISRRDSNHKNLHPTKFGNLYYFLSKWGKKYDYILECDSSSIITPNFVENCLCYFNTPLFDHSKDGGIIGNGSFYHTKNIISYINSKQSIFASSFGAIDGGAVELTSNTLLLHGWGAMYKTSVLMSIPIEDVECPICDYARGFWLAKNGYCNYLNPFDFTSKISCQNIETIKKQRLKWNTGDIFIFRRGLTNGKFPTMQINISAIQSAWVMDIFVPSTFFYLIIKVINCCCLNFYYFNLTTTIIITAISLLAVMAILVAMIIFKCSIKFFLLNIIGGIIDFAIVWKRCYTIIVIGYIKKTFSSKFVVCKNTKEKLSKSQKIRICLFDLLIIMVFLAISLFLSFSNIKINDKQLSIFLIWFQIFMPFAAPSILYILFVLFGDWKIKKGYDDEIKNYSFWFDDYRYKYVSQSQIWKKQHEQSID